VIEASNKTVEDLAVQIPGAARVFETLGIDYCCGGDVALSEACAKAGLQIELVLSSLEAAQREPAPASNWSRAPLAVLAQHIVEKHHAFVTAETTRLEALFKVCAAHAARHGELDRMQAIFSEMAQELRTHMMREERILCCRRMDTRRCSAGPAASFWASASILCPSCRETPSPRPGRAGSCGPPAWHCAGSPISTPGTGACCFPPPRCSNWTPSQSFFMRFRCAGKTGKVGIIQTNGALHDREGLHAKVEALEAVFEHGSFYTGNLRAPVLLSAKILFVPLHAFK
jgi:Domain of Unknown function (DUF542)